MKISKKFIVSFLAVTLLVCASGFTTVYAKAKTVDSNEEVEPRGIYTTLELNIYGNEGQVWATVKNKFTLFPSTVYVIVQLYSSDTYQESYQNMTLASQNSILDLDQGHTLTTSASTNGEQKYWQARAYYKIDRKDWQEKTTETWLIGGDGIVVL